MNIALCFSGGGYRAAAYHLGVLTYLNRIKLLPQVQIISTVSGGTLTGLSYARSLKKKQKFEEFYQNFERFLASVNLVKKSFEKIGHPSTGALGFQNLITSIADVYDEHLFSGDRFGMFWEPPTIPLQEMIFNATEFRTGIDFRFQKSRSKKAKIGNGNVEITREEAQKIRLADIAAASSCFPGGFEPLAFPLDFRWPDNIIPPSLQQKFAKALPLMDGGIYDNQGIAAAKLAIDRRKKKIGLFIISDTDTKRDDIFPYPAPMKSWSLSLKTFNNLLLTFIGLSIIGSLALIGTIVYTIQNSDSWVPTLLICGFPAVLLAVLAYLLFWARRKVIKEVLGRIPMIHLVAAWNDIRHLTINQVIEMAALRVKSLFALASSVFMKRIRGLIYTQVYSDEHYEGKRVSNLIYELDGTKDIKVPWLRPSEKIQEVTKVAASTPTTLWFGPGMDMSKLIACGEFSICYNLIDYIIRRYGHVKSEYPAWVRQLYDRLVDDWKKFQVNPMMME